MLSPSILYEESITLGSEPSTVVSDSSAKAGTVKEKHSINTVINATNFFIISITPLYYQ